MYARAQPHTHSSKALKRVHNQSICLSTFGVEHTHTHKKWVKIKYQMISGRRQMIVM